MVLVLGYRFASRFAPIPTIVGFSSDQSPRDSTPDDHSRSPVARSALRRDSPRPPSPRSGLTPATPRVLTYDFTDAALGNKKAPRTLSFVRLRSRSYSLPLVALGFGCWLALSGVPEARQRLVEFPITHSLVDHLPTCHTFGSLIVAGVLSRGEEAHCGCSVSRLPIYAI